VDTRATAIIIGAGPAGLTAAYLLGKASQKAVVLESDAEYVGGLSRTVLYKGFRFDIGGHRFFSKSQAVEDLWTEILGSDMLERPRLSRIYYRGRFFTYPIAALNALRNLGALESALCLLSYVRARLFPIENPSSVEAWVTNQFGKRLYRIFFKTYTEKVWGMSCRDISADWAAQRIKGLSFGTAVWNALFPPSRRADRAKVIKTLLNTFRYPRLGPGMMWEACRDNIRAMGGDVLLGQRVIRCRHVQATKLWEVTSINSAGVERTFTGPHLVSSAPMRDLARTLEPAPMPAAKEAAESLRYRDFIMVALVLKESANLPDNWIYIHDPAVKVGRIQVFKSWSPDLVPDSSMCCYGLEYFCFEGDGLWTSPDKDLVALATKELVQIGLAASGDVLDGCVVRQSKAYPVYDAGYARHVEVVRRSLAEQFPGLHLVGRNGMHKYNNQDHAMMTAMLTVKNILAGEDRFDVWHVNSDAEYFEDGAAGSGERLVPQPLSGRSR